MRNHRIGVIKQGTPTKNRQINHPLYRPCKGLHTGAFKHQRADAIAQVQAGARILDVNAGVPGVDEPALLQQVVRTVMEVTDVPLCIDTANPSALEAALSIYAGKALVNSVNGEEKSLKAVLPLVKEYDAAVIGLCMDKAVSTLSESDEQFLVIPPGGSIEQSQFLRIHL